MTARLRDARFFWEADRKTTLESRLDRLATLLFHKKLGSYKGKGGAHRAAGAVDCRAKRSAPTRRRRSTPARRRGSQRRISTTDMVREFTELQGTMGGIYAREEGLPEEVWKAIYFHYLPIGVEADAPPTTRAARQGRGHVGGGVARRQAGHDRRPVRRRREADRIARSVRAAPRGAGRRQDPGGPPQLTGIERAADRSRSALLEQAFAGCRHRRAEQRRATPAVADVLRRARLRICSSERGFRQRRSRARRRAAGGLGQPVRPLRRVRGAVPGSRRRRTSRRSRSLFKRVKNITQRRRGRWHRDLVGRCGRACANRRSIALPTNCSTALAGHSGRWRRADYRDAMRQLAQLSQPVDRFFVDVLVMADDPALRDGAAGAADASARHDPADLRRYLRDRRRRSEAEPDPRSFSAYRFTSSRNHQFDATRVTDGEERTSAATKQPAPQAAKQAREGKYVYFFGNGKADGNRNMKDLLGGKGSGLAEMTNAGLPVPPGFTISTDVCTIYYKEKREDPGRDRREIAEHVKKLEKAAGATLGSTDEPAARLGPLRREVLDARHDGHDPQPRAERRRRSKG